MRLMVCLVVLAFAALSLVACQAQAPVPPAAGVPSPVVAPATATPTAVPTASATAVRPSATAAVVDRTPTVLALPSWVPELNAVFRMELVPDLVLPANAEIVANPMGTCSAITFIDENRLTVLLVRREDGQYYRLSAKWLPEWRPVGRFKWLSKEVFSFEMWGNPYNGYQYTVNVVSGQIIGVEAYHW